MICARISFQQLQVCLPFSVVSSMDIALQIRWMAGQTQSRWEEEGLASPQIQPRPRLEEAQQSSYHLWDTTISRTTMEASLIRAGPLWATTWATTPVDLVVQQPVQWAGPPSCHPRLTCQPPVAITAISQQQLLLGEVQGIIEPQMRHGCVLTTGN